MFKGINNNFNKGIHTGLYTQKDLGKTEETKEVKKEEAAKAETKELGDDLLDPRLFTNALGFIRQAKNVEKEDADDLNQLFALAGMGKIPTEAQYASIANATNAFAGGIEKLTTANNAERLFASNNFQALNKQFGIS